MWRTQRAIENFNSSQPLWILTDFFFCNILNLYSTVQRLIHCPRGLMQLMSAEQRGVADPTVKQESRVLPGSNPRLIPTQFGACSGRAFPHWQRKSPPISVLLLRAAPPERRWGWDGEGWRMPRKTPGCTVDPKESGGQCLRTIDC